VAISKNEMLASAGITLFKKPISDLCLVMHASDTVGKTTSRFF
jgi:hypothetical protein